MPESTPTPPASDVAFAYQSQGTGDQTFSGTIDAPDIAAAAAKLAALHISYTLLEPVQKPARSKSFGPADFLAFNRQLGQLTKAGLPIERTLRLMASEMGNPQARAVKEIAAELEKGTPLGEAFASHKQMFPPLYGMLLDAGVRTNNLPGMLLNIGRHVETIQRLRAALWRAVSYPLMVMVALALVLSFIWFYLIPQFDALNLPMMPGAIWRNSPTAGGSLNIYWMQSAARVMSGGMLVCVLGVLLAFVLTIVLARASAGRRFLEPLVHPLPLIGPILRWNLLARWCDALHLCIQAGMDLPAALRLAGNAIDSSRLRESSLLLADAVSAGRPMDQESFPAIMPPLIPTALQLGAEKNDLDAAVGSLATMYREQAEVRLAVLPQVLSPVLLIATAVAVGLAILSALWPLVWSIRSLGGQ
jgi:type II secretory pathway component PulF